jgi:hypothetical protein
MTNNAVESLNEQAADAMWEQSCIRGNKRRLTQLTYVRSFWGVPRCRHLPYYIKL